MSSEKKLSSASVVKKKDEDQSLIEFPCEFPIKVMGPATSEFNDVINKIAISHDDMFDSNKTTKKLSKTGKYASLTLNIYAKNQLQLDAIYKDFTDHELVLWAL